MRTVQVPAAIDIDMGPSPDKLMLIGDTHHDIRFMLNVIDYAHEQGVDTLLQVGDFGWWPSRFGDEMFVSEIEPVMDRLGQRLFWVDGNHEDHGSITPGMTMGVVQHLPRGFRWRWWDKTWMAVGGGVSVDQHWRIQGLDWFPEEALSSAEIAYCTRPGDVDIIVSHDAPDGVAELDRLLRPGLFPADQIAQSDGHRRVLGHIVDTVSASTVVHGHYHKAYRGRRGHVGVIGLANNEYSIEAATLILTRDDVGDHNG